MTTPLTENEVASFLSRFRKAQYAALEDAENFTDICFLIEELGCRLKGKKGNGLYSYKSVILELCNKPDNGDFSIFYDLLRESRNDKAHKGVYARSSTHRALKICITIEEALVSKLLRHEVRYLMSENPIFAQDFFTMSKLREVILENSFSYLPYRYEESKFKIVSDLEIARIWKSLTTDESRYVDSFKKHLDISTLPEAETLRIEDDVEAALKKLSAANNRPLIVLDAGNRVQGILTAFDLL